jgi:hypothetical protein
VNRAIIVIDRPDQGHREQPLAAWIRRRGYQFVGALADQGLALKMLFDGHASILVYAGPDWPKASSLTGDKTADPSVAAGGDAVYQTAVILPRGDDDGFAENFLINRLS